MQRRPTTVARTLSSFSSSWSFSRNDQEAPVSGGCQRALWSLPSPLGCWRCQEQRWGSCGQTGRFLKRCWCQRYFEPQLLTPLSPPLVTPGHVSVEITKKQHKNKTNRNSSSEMSIVTLATQQQNAMVAGFTHLLGNLVKKHRQSQGDYANSPMGDPSTTQLLWQAEAKGGLLLPTHAALQRGVPMLQDSCRVQGQEGGEDGIHGDVWDDASISGHWEKLLGGGSRGDTQTRTCQDHCLELCCVCSPSVCACVFVCETHSL